MQVKKFEAKTMKEALELVKVHLGPEAIILSARDTHRGFGLLGDKSVEVTAAVSEETLRRKKLYEAKLREDLRKKFQEIPASKQKEFINKVAERSLAQTSARRVEGEPAERRELITVGGPARTQTQAQTQAQARRQSRSSSPPQVSPPRIPAQLAQGLRYIDIPDDDPSMNHPLARRGTHGQPYLQTRSPRAPLQLASSSEPLTHEMRALSSQVEELKGLVEQFRKHPQVPVTMHPGADFGLPFELSASFQKLTRGGIDSSLVADLLKRAQRDLDSSLIRDPAMLEAWIAREVLKETSVVAEPLVGRYHVFMGPSGQGKTSTLVKFASRILLSEKKTIALISLDTIKVGAADQMRIYAQILNVPFAVARDPEDWIVAEAKLAGVEYVLVDCPGLSLHRPEEMAWLNRILPPAQFARSLHYVQSILGRDEEVMAAAGRYQMLGFHDVIFTRIDESSRHGLLLNFQRRFAKPLHSFGTGPGIPEDYEFAKTGRIIELLFKVPLMNSSPGGSGPGEPTSMNLGPKEELK